MSLLSAYLTPVPSPRVERGVQQGVKVPLLSKAVDSCGGNEASSLDL
jgi:hypothetical protein